jgi:hypothetical protein
MCHWGEVKWEWELTKDECRVGLFEPGEIPKVGGLAELVAFHGWVSE